MLPSLMAVSGYGEQGSLHKVLAGGWESLVLSLLWLRRDLSSCDYSYSGNPKSRMLVWPIQSVDTQHAILQCLHSPDTLPLQILTQEDWNKVLYNGMASTSSWAALYFIALMTFGNYVLFNLLVAILVEGFQTEVMSSCLCLCFLFKF